MRDQDVNAAWLDVTDPHANVAPAKILKSDEAAAFAEATDPRYKKSLTPMQIDYLKGRNPRTMPARKETICVMGGLPQATQEV